MLIKSEADAIAAAKAAVATLPGRGWRYHTWARPTYAARGDFSLYRGMVQIHPMIDWQGRITGYWGMITEIRCVGPERRTAPAALRAVLQLWFKALRRLQRIGAQLDKLR